MKYAAAVISTLLAAVAAQQPYAVQGPPLKTRWTDQVGTNPWPSHPRPQMFRQDWQTLNGLWQFSPTDAQGLDSPPTGQNLERQILVPSCIESGLSGIQEDQEFSWWKTSFQAPNDWPAGKTLINFGAVDYEATVFVNGQNAGFHRGGYTRFSVDITDHIKDENEILVHVHDPSDTEGINIPLGKQRRYRRSHIFYQPCSGIWQSAWIERVPTDYITDVLFDAQADGSITATITGSDGSSGDVTVSIRQQGSSDEVAKLTGPINTAIKGNVDNVEVWAPGAPKLYDIVVNFKDDNVQSYAGFRTVGKAEINGILRPTVNGKWYFPFSTLDQGYWPDGIYTPPTKEAMQFDVDYLKEIGFNTIRKHIKVEPDEYYAYTDQQGIMVWQDMPSMPHDTTPNDDQTAEYDRQSLELIKTHAFFPSIITWVLYNEGWGQQDGPIEEGITNQVRDADSTRNIDSVSGWNDHGFGDYKDVHTYSDSQCGLIDDEARIQVQGEFGGVGLNMSADQLWPDPAAIATIPETYEIAVDTASYNNRSIEVIDNLTNQVRNNKCSAGVYTQTTDTEGEINGLISYSRDVSKANIDAWKAALQRLYDAAREKGGF
ncbi:hypothetical protein E3Q19_02254 [Wallemia mellicola]|nr:hypothetical protein E3Q19_02254 [Wallemia mellicola]